MKQYGMSEFHSNLIVCLMILVSRSWAALALEEPQLPCSRRRVFLAQALGGFVPLAMQSSSSFAIPADENKIDSKIYKMKSGVQFRNIRTGGGPFVTDNSDDKKKATVAVHIKALLRDGSTLVDTREQGDQPILYQLGSAFELSDASILTPGIDDALVSRGVTADTAERVEPMREGGIRLAVIPSELAYGNAGVSRYQAWKSQGLQRAVPRDELIRYEIEVLRCLDVPVDAPTPDGGTVQRTVQACCSEDAYPCPTPTDQSS